MAETKQTGGALDKAASALETAAAFLLFLGLLDMLLQVGARALVPQLAPPWTEEAIRLLLVWISFVGAGAATLRGLHLTIDLIPIGSEVVLRVWNVAIAVLVALLCVALLYGGVIFVKFASRSVTPGLGLPGYIYYLPLVIFSAVTFCHAVWDAIANGIALVRSLGAPADRPSSSG